MTTIIFSDTHLSNRVYRKKFFYLKHLIQSADQVIILGDFWDGFLTTFDKFVESGWRFLFPLLLQKKAIYLYGNHDRIEWSDDRVNLFSVRQEQELVVNLGGQQYLLTHGHALKTSLEDRFTILDHSMPLRLGSSLDILHKLVWGRRFLKADKLINRPMIDWARDALPEPAILVCGHTHFPQHDLPERYLNDGFIGCGFGNYLKISEQGAELICERY
jgi:predicted phosphodiesterase